MTTVVIATIARARGSVGDEPPSYSATLVSSNGTASGQAELTLTFGALQYQLELVGLARGQYDALLRDGSCAAPGTTAGRLGALFAGDRGEAAVSGAVALNLEDAAEWHIVVLDASEQPMACGAIISE